jgi:hypothetical protein
MPTNSSQFRVITRIRLIIISIYKDGAGAASTIISWPDAKVGHPRTLRWLLFHNAHGHMTSLEGRGRPNVHSSKDNCASCATMTLPSYLLNLGA